MTSTDEQDRPWTMSDLRKWVADHEHVPGDREVSATLPERPRHWARAPFYVNDLLGLYVPDLDDAEPATVQATRTSDAATEDREGPS